MPHAESGKALHHRPGGNQEDSEVIGLRQAGKLRLENIQCGIDIAFYDELTGLAGMGVCLIKKLSVFTVHPAEHTYLLCKIQYR